jgi:DNA gyrase subunit A
MVMITAEINIEDLITPEDMVVTLSHTGYFKRQPLAEYRPRSAAAAASRRRRPRTKTSSTSSSSPTPRHRAVLLQPRALYWLKVYEVPQGTRNSRGKPIVNLFPLVEGEKITAVLPIKEFDEEHFVFMATSDGHGQEDRAHRVLAARARPASSRSTWTTATT